MCLKTGNVTTCITKVKAATMASCHWQPISKSVPHPPILPKPVVACSVGVRSEQAMEHSAPSPSSIMFDLKVTVSRSTLELKFFGPLFWQNLRNINNSQIGDLCVCSQPLGSKREEIPLSALAVCLAVSKVKLWAGDHQGWTGTRPLHQDDLTIYYKLNDTWKDD